MNRKTIGLAMCGSFCTFARVLDAFSALDREIGRASCRERV